MEEKRCRPCLLPDKSRLGEMISRPMVTSPPRLPAETKVARTCPAGPEAAPVSRLLAPACVAGAVHTRGVPLSLPCPVFQFEDLRDHGEWLGMHFLSSEAWGQVSLGCH